MSALSSVTSSRVKPALAHSSRVVSGNGASAESRDVSPIQPAASSTNIWAPIAVEASVGVACTRSCGRWALPVGTVTVNIVPLPSSLATDAEPPWSLVSSRTSARPMPVPS